MDTLGDKAFKVEWCHELPCVPGTTDADIDGARYSHRIFRSEADAIAFARKVSPKDHFGGPLIYPVEWTDPYADIPDAAGQKRHFRWKECGEPKEI